MSVVRRDQGTHGHRCSFPHFWYPTGFRPYLYGSAESTPARMFVVKLKKLGGPAASFAFQSFLV